VSTIIEGEILQPGEWTPTEAAEYVRQSWQTAVESIIETGRRLTEAKRQVGHGNWLAAVDLMPFSEDTAQLLMRVSNHSVLSNTECTRYLPAAWATLAELAKLPAGELLTLIEVGKITPDLQQNEARSLVAAHRRKGRPQIDPAPTVTAAGPFDVIYSDPPWRYQFAETDNRAIENHYPTMDLEAICQLNPPAHEDAVLFLWATATKIDEALRVMAAWGFDYKTSMVWIKDKIGMGYYVRNQHELLLIGKRGELPVPEPANRPPSILTAHRGVHSKKPDEFYTLIESMYPGRAYAEIFARQTRPGWFSWGNQL
jgi:N6-adenosine-specific RNA methylase IME4